MKALRRASRRARRQLAAMVSAGYYRFAFGRESRFAGRLAAAVEAWEAASKAGDVPRPPSSWDAQYQDGHWAYLHALEQLGRYSTLVGYLHHLKPGGAVLDVGCGDGRLLQLYRPYGYCRYLGLEVSSAALGRLATASDARTTFLCVDAEVYEPSETFDAMIFNETLYYFRDPLTAFRRYATALRPDGIALISSFTDSARATAILRALKRAYPLLDEVEVTRERKSWLCTVLRPDSPSAGEARAVAGLNSGR